MVVKQLPPLSLKNSVCFCSIIYLIIYLKKSWNRGKLVSDRTWWIWFCEKVIQVIPRRTLAQISSSQIILKMNLLLLIVALGAPSLALKPGECEGKNGSCLSLSLLDLGQRDNGNNTSIHLLVKIPPGPIHPESESLRGVFPSESEAPFANISGFFSILST